MSVASPARAYAQPLDQQDGSPLLHLPSPMFPERKPGAVLAEGLRMSPKKLPDNKPSDDQSPGAPAPGPPFGHRPVMLEEVVGMFAGVPEGVVLDATVGGGGHALGLLRAFPQLRVVGLDQDGEAVAAAKSALAQFGARAVVVRARFDALGTILDELGVKLLSGAIFDLGVSSPQLDRPDRGFSYRFDGPLDMRMDRSQGLTAEGLVNESTQAQLATLFALHGETSFARRIAAAVVSARPLTTTQQLADVVSSAVPAAARRRGHPAKRVFQALRAAVNSELEVLPLALDAALERLAPGGRIVVMAYHSGEDRAVKQRLVYAATGGCNCPPGLPCVCGAVPTVRLLNRGARKPSAEELAANPRAESARLRAAEALPLVETRPR
ncbi:MAG TPA: 16S rRNA (cytosine(1402)-N(4))-methyltransferase RsmH [Acidimicrobiales bacterium]|nr:16S rRNA (cytosine(1402)-N(4))-methyltransferase RsmH [Acidimicrobiales bacterium]